MSRILASIKFDRKDDLEFQEKMAELGMLGLSLKECGDYFGLDPDDWLEWCEQHPIAEARLNCGKAHGIALAGEKLRAQIKQGKITAIMFYLKTQGNFEEKSLMKFETPLKFVHMPPPPIPSDPVEAAKTYQQYMKDS